MPPLTDVHDIEGKHLDDLLELYGEAWWTPGRTAEGVRRMLRASDVVVGIVDGDRLVAFARALTDGEHRAFVYDVIAAPDRRGEGLGDLVVGRLLDRLGGVETIELVCRPDMAAFYGRFGFTDDLGGSITMRRTATAG